MSSDIYASDPDARPDAEFLPGELRYLVIGNRGRLLDARRTPIDLTRHISRREGDPRLYDLLDEVMTDRGLAELDHDFSATFVTNPASGELVKGHAIVLAELGLCP
ncbi:MAG TPA: hypothetical protein VFH80_12790 [Solirubrobacteraceae bacterium]|nr:hypothetical protein [Solirubrobacteraceae bacterium]